jgi:RimJ/RimL family protein N-acetyltransferase
MADRSPGVVLIRPVELTDGPLIEQYASDSRISESSHVPHPYPRGGGLAFAAKAVGGWKNGSEQVFAVTVDGELAGLVSLMAINRLRGSAQVGYWIAVPYWGRGVATRALALAVRFAFHDRRLVELGAVCLAKNPASARVLEKNGFIEQAPVVYQGPDRRFLGQQLRTFLLWRRATAWGGRGSL